MFGNFVITLLYQPSTKSSFNDRTLHEFNEAYTEIKQTCQEETMLHLPGGQITENDVASAIRDLKLKKARGEDKIQNEHFITEDLQSCLI